MSRSGYTEDYGDDRPGQLELYRSNVVRAFGGRRGRRFLEELRDALDAMPEKRLISHDLIRTEEDPDEPEPGVCTLGCALMARQLDPARYDPEDHQGLGKLFDVPDSLIREIEWLNDEESPDEPERRWKLMRDLVERYIADPQDAF